jgi:hypothetical protein
MDLLQQPVKGSGIDRRRLLLSDDRQIDVLIVNYYLRKLTEPEIRIRVGTIANFAQDLALVKRIRNKNFSDADRRGSNWGWDENAHGLGEETLNDAITTLKDWERDRAAIEARLGRAAFETGLKPKSR